MYKKDDIYLRRCIEIAQNGLGNTAPNPLVGSVIVHENKIIGEGYHQNFGGPHAEVNAINSVKNPLLLEKSTLYVNLEPCSHYGKTPPCADLIIEKKIPRVVIGILDSNEKVSGRGRDKLIAAGVEVVTGCIEDECWELNKRFFTFHEKKRPYIILKWAETSDGFIDIIREPSTKAHPTWITDETVRALVHKWRAEEQAIMIGTNTALFDNPKLNTRDWHGQSPLRVVLDRTLRLPKQLHVFDGSQPTLVFTEQKSQNSNNLNYIQIGFDDKILDTILNELVQRNIQSVIVEGGAKLLQSFIEKGLWDEAMVFRSDMSFGNGVKAPVLKNIPVLSTRLIKSVLYKFVNK
jgi:diaminohydroxyphosphoribosylaminopyrimidine deaminase/5-amino-6-(5-phosphoribosylamino)uracil reductase